MNPYTELPSRAFWRPAVADISPTDICDMWRPKFTFTKSDPVATLGSCFAQHISRALTTAGFNWLNAEPAPPKLSPELQMKFGFGVFSARVGNIYTVALLKQWTEWAFGLSSPPDEIWRQGNSFYDPFRPNIEPEAFLSEDEVVATRAYTIRALRYMFASCKVFVFTLGLTEAWVNSEGGYVYPICPGTIAGEFAPNLHKFKNYTYPEIYNDFCSFLEIVKAINPSIKIILTVSPVPLTATASGNHVLVATTQSKSILRAAAAALEAEFDNVEYFPSYEIISSFPFKGMYYEKNMRSIKKEGVANVMRLFFEGLSGGRNESGLAVAEVLQDEPPGASQISPVEDSIPVDVVCEEMMLDQFRGKP